MNNGNQFLENDNNDGKIIALWADVFAVSLALIVAYNERAREDNNLNYFFDLKIERYILLISKIIFLLIIIYFLYVAYINYRDRDKFNNVESHYLLIQLISAILMFLAALLSFYVLLDNWNMNESVYENPEI